MLSPEVIKSVREECEVYWREEVTKPYFTATAQGKEIGHRLADLIDDKTSALLTVNHLTKYQAGGRGERRVRSMGDIWLEHEGIYHPVNVKAGVAGSEGQPNMVSLKKLLNALILQQLDSYYLLMVKLEIGEAITPTVYFTDMLEHLDFVTFDSGPGQIMLKAKKFFAAFDPDAPAKQESPVAKVQALMDLYEDGEKRLKRNRERVLIGFREQVAAYLQQGSHSVSPHTQQGLHLQ